MTTWSLSFNWPKSKYWLSRACKYATDKMSFCVELLVLCLLLSNTARLFVMAVGHFDDPEMARTHATYFTADFLSSHFSHEASRRFDSEPCVSLTYASERKRSLRYLFGPTVVETLNYWKYVITNAKLPLYSDVETTAELYMPFAAGTVYADLKSSLPVVDSNLAKSKRGIMTPFDAYISIPSPLIDQTIFVMRVKASYELELVRFATVSKPRKNRMPEVSFILKQVRKTGLLKQGQQIRNQQMLAAYLGRHCIQRTYSQKVLDDSKASDGEEVYWLSLPEKSGRFYPRLFKDPQWTFELVIKFLTYSLPSLQGGHGSRVQFFEDYLNANGIIPGIRLYLMLQRPKKTSLLIHAFLQDQKYRFLAEGTVVSITSYQKSLIGDDVISPPMNYLLDTPGILLGARRTLLQGNEGIVCVHAKIDFQPSCALNLSALRSLKMPFRIPKGLSTEALKLAEALRQLSEMTKLNGLEENFDREEEMLLF